MAEVDALPERDGHWNRERVCWRAIKCMAGLAGARALKVIGCGDLQANEWGVGPIAEGVDFIAISSRVLGQASHSRAAMFGRARCQIPGRELSWSEYCREMGWGRKAADRAADEACDKLAKALNAMGVPYVRIPIDSAPGGLRMPFRASTERPA